MALAMHPKSSWARSVFAAGEVHQLASFEDIYAEFLERALCGGLELLSCDATPQTVFMVEAGYKG